MVGNVRKTVKLEVGTLIDVFTFQCSCITGTTTIFSSMLNIKTNSNAVSRLILSSHLRLAMSL